MKEKICVFGMGTYYSFKKSIIADKYDICAFIDNRLPVGETDWQDGIKVYNPKAWLVSNDETGVVLMAADWFGMWKQLKEYGVSDDRIILSCSLQPFYDRTEEVLDKNGISISLENDAIMIRGERINYVVKNEEELRTAFRLIYKDSDPIVGAISGMALKPSSTRFGLERGKPVDRIYIERFLEENKDCIYGRVVEIGDDRYMTQYADQIDEAVIMHVNGWGGLKANLATGEGIVDNYADCLICTQTLQHIYDIHSCIDNIYRILKPGGTALITNGCLGELSLYDYNNWGEFWKFTDMAAKKLFCERFEDSKVSVKTYGNAKAAIAFLYGMCAEELPTDTFDYLDKQFQMIIAVKAMK